MCVCVSELREGGKEGREGGREGEGGRERGRERGREGGREGGRGREPTLHFMTSDSESRRAINCIFTSSDTIGSTNVQNDWLLEENHYHKSCSGTSVNSN